jgi:hypothetical protein
VTIAPLAIRWIAMDAPHDRAAVATALGVDFPAGDRIDIAGLRLEIAEGGPGPGQARARLEVIGDGAGAGRSLADAWPLGAAEPSDSPTSAARLLALGWATVELERAASSWPDVRWEAAPRDSLVGARSLVARARLRADAPPARPAPADVVTIVLLEPDTEGRLAASLARHGEGPAVLYVRVPRDTNAGLPARLARLGMRARAGPGPFGPEWAIHGPHASSPTLVVVPEAEPADPGNPVGSAAADAVPSSHDRTGDPHIPGRRPGRR